MQRWSTELAVRPITFNFRREVGFTPTDAMARLRQVRADVERARFLAWLVLQREQLRKERLESAAHVIQGQINVRRTQASAILRQLHDIKGLELAAREKATGTELAEMLEEGMVNTAGELRLALGNVLATSNPPIHIVESRERPTREKMAIIAAINAAFESVPYEI